MLALLGALLYGMSAGLRGDIGIFLISLVENSGAGYGDVSFAIALMQLIFGASQPLFGLLAMRKSNRFVLLLGIFCLGGGVLLLPFATNFLLLMLALGVGFGIGTGAISFGILLSVLSRKAGRENAMFISGILNASSGLGSFALSPVIQGLLDTGGLTLTSTALIVPLACLVPIMIWLTATKKEADEKASPAQPAKAEQSSVKAIFREAFQNRSYRLLICGFSTCGFHMVIIEAHLYSHYISYGIMPEIAAWVFSAYGIATISGALLSGYLSTRISKGKLLGFYYGFRAVWVVLYLFFLPKTPATSLLFSIGLGLTGDATVSPTSGIVNREFSLAKISALIGFLFFCHQIGAFLSSWLGGVFVEITGGYIAIWTMDIALCLFASLMSLRIRD